MGRYHLLRLFGIVVLLGAILPAVVMMANARWLLAVVAWAIVATGLYIAVVGDRGIEQCKADVVRKKKHAALNFDDSSLTLELRWMRALFSILLLTVLGALGFMASFALFFKGNYIAAFVSLCVGLLLVCAAGSTVVTAFIAYRDGILVRMDLLGIALWGKAPISWRLIEGIDLKEVEVKGRKNYQLILAMKPEYFLHSQAVNKLAWMHWTAPRADHVSRTLAVSCALLNADPLLIVQAAKVIADRFGSNRIKDWMHAIPIDEAVALRNTRAEIESSDREAQRLLARLNTLGARSDANPQEVMETTRKLELSLQRTSALGNAQLDVMKSQTKRMNAQFIKLKWAVVVVFTLGMGVIILKIVSALGR